MKVFIVLAALLAVAKGQMPQQTFFIPMPEKDTFDITFRDISSGASKPVTSMISFAVSTDDTVIWYDHWEDGYDSLEGYVTGAVGSTTEIWGDGDCSNGYAEGTSCNSDEDDRLIAGQSIVIQDIVPATNQIYDGNGNPYYDGRDKILASSPIAITRGMYPDDPGSLMAGAVEVMDTSKWGTHFVAPIGQDQASRDFYHSSWEARANGYEHTSFYIMAAEDDTVVTFYNRFGSVSFTETLDEGESYTWIIDYMGESIQTTKPVQVDLITGDTGSSYELRWFSLVPREEWASAYFSPIGDSVGNTRGLIYNPHSTSLTVYRELESGNSYSWTIPAKDIGWTYYTPTGTGAEYTANKEFLVLSVTDTLSSTSGQIYDWGMPISPTNKLTPQALIGWGYGCTSNDCGSGNSRSVVWASPVADADIYVDVDNDGSWDIRRTGVNRLESEIFTDSDNDLSGAVIWAVAAGQSADSSNMVDIAVAWGQDPSRSYSGDGRALDLGTMVPPMDTLGAREGINLKVDVDGDQQISPGDICTYRIRVQNVGQRSYQPGEYKFVQCGIQANLPRQTLVSGSGEFFDGTTVISVPDSALTSSSGYGNPTSLALRGGEHYLSFDIVVGAAPVLDIPAISNGCDVTRPGLGPSIPVSAGDLVYLTPEIEIVKTVWLGPKPTCNDGSELVYGSSGELVTYCYKVINRGNCYLDNVSVEDPDINMPPDSSIPLLAPGEEAYVSFEDNIPPGGITSFATCSGDPVLVNSNPIPTYTGGPVTDTDDAGVAEGSVIPIGNPAIKIEKTVLLENWPTCFTGEELQYGYDGTLVTYCFEVFNTGNIDLTGVTVTDPTIGASFSVGDLAAGASTFTNPFPTQITSTLSSPATATGTPIAGGGSVSDTDPAGVVLLPPAPPCA